MAPSRFIAVFSAQRDRLLDSVHRFSPCVELYARDGLLLEVPVHREQETLHYLSHLIDRQSRIGGASTRTAALLAAAVHSGTFVPFGREDEFVASLPVHSLSVCPEIDEATLVTLKNWGIQTLGEISTLPENSLISRLGRKGRLIRRLASGEESCWMERHLPRPEYRECRDLDWTVQLLDPLLFVIGSMLESLCAKLGERGLAMESLETSFGLEDGTSDAHLVKFALPLQDPKVILSLVRLELQSRTFKAGVQSLSIEAVPARPRPYQHSLLRPTAPSPEKLERTLKRLANLVGAERVGSPRPADSHRPDSVHLAELQATRSSPRKASVPKRPAGTVELSLRRLRPPRRTELKSEEILRCAGPWRSSGDWWRAGEPHDAWSRDEWDVELTEGGIYRVYWDHIQKQWFLEGVYD
jgi:protein ImuB